MKLIHPDSLKVTIPSEGIIYTRDILLTASRLAEYLVIVGVAE
jgi:hypothetical protein